jgi:hypothetical protein
MNLSNANLIREHVEANRLHPDGRHMLANNVSPELAERIRLWF